MKKTFLGLLMAASAMMVSCTETFQPSIDYGSQVFINDYQGLIDAVNNVNRSLNERMDALNKVLDAGLASIKVSVDDNTRQIELFKESTDDRLSDINTTMLEGLKALKVSVDSLGNSVVTAIDETGNIIKLQIDDTGKLLEAQIKGMAESIVEVVNNHSAALSERIDSLNSVIANGIAEIVVTVEAGDSTISASVDALTDAVGDLNLDILDGFKMVSDSLSANGERIVTAINDNGESLRLQLDSNGQLITALANTLSEQFKALIDALADNSKSLNGKLDTLNIAITEGIASVKVAIEESSAADSASSEAIKLAITDVKSGIEKIDETLFKGFTVLDSTITANGDKIVTIIDEQGEAIGLEIHNGALLIASKPSSDELSQLNYLLNSEYLTIEDRVDLINKTTAGGEIEFQVISIESGFYMYACEVKNGNTVRIDYFSGFNVTGQIDSPTNTANQEITLVKGEEKVKIVKTKSLGKLVDISVIE